MERELARTTAGEGGREGGSNERANDRYGYDTLQQSTQLLPRLLLLLHGVGGGGRSVACPPTPPPRPFNLPQEISRTERRSHNLRLDIAE